MGFQGRICLSLHHGFFGSNPASGSVVDFQGWILIMVCTVWALILNTVPNIVSMVWPGTNYNTITWFGTKCFFQIVCYTVFFVANAVFEISTDREKHNPSRPSLDHRVIRWNKVAWMFASKNKNSPSTINNYLLFDVQTAYSTWKDDMIPFPFDETGFLFFCCRPSTSWPVVYKSQERQEPSIISQTDTMFNEWDHVIFWPSTRPKNTIPR